ncbi:hypothetical protein L9F63_004510, partial [Diploptera punctata]
TTAAAMIPDDDDDFYKFTVVSLTNIPGSYGLVVESKQITVALKGYKLFNVHKKVRLQHSITR